MGQDLLLVHLWTSLPAGAVDFDAIGAAIDNLTETSVSGIQDLGSGAYDNGDGEVDLAQVKGQLHEDLADLKAVWQVGDRRMAYRTSVGPLEVAVTGGGSWGDSPTDEFDAWNRLAEANVLEAGGFFA